MYLIETSYKGFGLLHNPPLHPPSSHALNVFLLVFLRHLDVGASRLQLPLYDLSKDVKRAAAEVMFTSISGMAPIKHGFILSHHFVVCNSFNVYPGFV